MACLRDRDPGANVLSYKPSELLIEVDDALERGGRDVCGYGEVDAETQRPLISLAITKGCCDRSRWDREILVFHELGHALIGRDHRDVQLPNGLRASIMNSGNIFGLYSKERAEHRVYYIDELFNLEPPVPAWGY